MKQYIDRKYSFYELFDDHTGFYYRSGVLDDCLNDTGVDPFMRSFPALIDIGIMGKCVCASRCNVDCYQNAIVRNGKPQAHNMSIEDYKSIMAQSQDKVFQCALGGAGDPDTHEYFAEILKLSRDHGIVPNFTTSGILMTPDKAKLCGKYCGAVAVSEHNADYTRRAIDLLVAAGVKTNVHFVLSNQSIDLAIQRLKENHYGDLNAVVFLLYKPVGQGRADKVLSPDDPRLREFFAIVDEHKTTHKIGFDSCTAPAIINYTSNIDLNSLDFCEGARYSLYIDSAMNAMPCSFGNQDPKWFVSLHENTIEEAWNSEIFNRFRASLRNACPGCKNRAFCAGGCPIVRNIVLCKREEKDCDQHENQK